LHQILKSSYPNAGAQWTIPVPVYESTNSASNILNHPFALFF